MAALSKNTIFTNVALTPEGGVWWEGMTDEPPPNVSIGRAKSGRRKSPRKPAAKAAHPNGASLRRLHSAHDRSAWEDPNAYHYTPSFRGRRAATMPLVYQSLSIEFRRLHRRDDGFGNIRRPAGPSAKFAGDPMAMLPFCGYHMGDYFRHWIKMQRSLTVTPRIFHVNWFRKTPMENHLAWLQRKHARPKMDCGPRSRSRSSQRKRPIGWVPHYEDMEWKGLDFPLRKSKPCRTSTTPLGATKSSNTRSSSSSSTTISQRNGLRARTPHLSFCKWNVVADL